MADVTQISVTVSKFSKALQANPWHIDMKSFEISHPDVPSIMTSFDPKTWPTGEQIVSKLTNMTNLFTTLNKIWNSIPEADRKSLGERPSDLLGKFHP
jgi:hypothetical protein